jgi:hypothetical protein
MTRTMLSVVGVALLMVGSWSVGHAQTPAPLARRFAQFEIMVETPRGSVKVTCEGGCDWPENEGTVVCDSERCSFRFNQHGRILLGLPLQVR